MTLELDNDFRSSASPVDAEAAASRGTRIVVFGFDVAEISQIRRIRAIRSKGYDVHSFTMRRANMNTDFQPEWPNTHLFVTDNEQFLKRIAVVLGSAAKMLSPSNREIIRNADAIIARNLDMLAIAWLASLFAGSRHVPLIYECLDINRSLSASGLKSRFMRFAERILLNRIALLVVSSPGFVREYFGKIQGFEGPWALLENKIAVGLALPERPRGPPARRQGEPIRLGWVGTIRCAPSLAILAEVAHRLRERVSIEIHGVVHHHAVPGFDDVIVAHPNMHYHGPYAYPDDLGHVYRGCDLVWAQDLWQHGKNSDWLLPNRIYEASWAGCPSVALSETETGRRIAEDGLGWVIDRPEARDLVCLLEMLDAETLRERSETLLNAPPARFVQSGDEIDAVFEKACEVCIRPDIGSQRQLR